METSVLARRMETSVLAQMYVDEHPCVLNLDVDQLRLLIGGWRERFAETVELVRAMAVAMARTHLSAGHDVGMPQYLGRLSEAGLIHRTYEAMTTALERCRSDPCVPSRRRAP